MTGLVPDPWAGHPAWPKVRRAIALMHAGSLVYLLVTTCAYLTVFGGFHISVVAWLPFFLQLVLVAYLTLACLAAVVADVVVSRGLRQRRPWAWIAALVTFGLDASSLLLLPLAIFGLMVLADDEVRAAFDEVETRSPKP